MKNKTKILLICSSLTLLSVSTIATPILKGIKAHYKQNIQYTLNGDEVLNGKGGLIYEDRVYVPLRDMAELLGVEVDYKDNIVILNNELNNLPKYDIEIKREERYFSGKIIDILNTSIVVLPDSKDNVVENYVILNSQDYTKYNTIDGKELTFDKFEIGMNVDVVHSPQMTRSLPPQTNLYNLVLKSENKEMDFTIKNKSFTFNVEIPKNVSPYVSLTKIENNKETIILLTFEKENSRANIGSFYFYEEQDYENLLNQNTPYPTEVFRKDGYVVGFMGLQDMPFELGTVESDLIIDYHSNLRDMLKSISFK